MVFIDSYFISPRNAIAMVLSPGKGTIGIDFPGFSKSLATNILESLPQQAICKHYARAGFPTGICDFAVINPVPIKIASDTGSRIHSWIENSLTIMTATRLTKAIGMSTFHANDIS